MMMMMMIINVNNINNNNILVIIIIIINWLRAGWSGDRIPIGVRFSSLGQTGPGDHPLSSIMGTESFPGVKRPRRDVDQPPPTSAKSEERAQLSLLPLWAFLARSRVNFALLSLVQRIAGRCLLLRCCMLPNYLQIFVINPLNTELNPICQ